MEYEGLKIRELALDEKPRERLMQYGVNALSNAELLAIIISCGTKKESAISLANRVLAIEDGYLPSFSGYQFEEYKKISGIGDATACKIAAAIEFGRRICMAPKIRKKLSGPGDVAEYCSDMKHFQKEFFRILLIDVKMQLIGKEDVSIGSISGAFASPREVYSNAVRKGAYAIIAVHNHPSGDPNPSAEDIETTNILLTSGNVLGIKFLDHVIIGDVNYFSFKENNLLKEK